MKIPANLRLRYARTVKNDGTGKIVPDQYEDVIFASLDTEAEKTWTPKGVVDQHYALVLNPDIARGKIKWPPEREFEAVK